MASDHLQRRRQGPRATDTDRCRSDDDHTRPVDLAPTCDTGPTVAALGDGCQLLGATDD